MDVDGPSNLKRSSSAPMINELNSVSASVPSRVHSPRSDGGIFNLFSAASLPRTRRFSASCSSPLIPESPRLSSARVTQLRHEERIESVHGRELEHEREMHNAIQMSQSCEDLALLPSLTNNHNNGTKDIVMGVSSPSSPVGSNVLGSFSPTRDRATPTRNHHLPSVLLRRPLSPSPTRKTFMSRRSLSPIAMRPSALTPVKRKFDLDHSDNEHMGSPGSSCSSGYLSPPAKRLSVGTSLAFGPDGHRAGPLSPGGGRFLFRPLTSASQQATPPPSSPSLTGSGVNSASSSSRDEPMLDEEEEMQIGRHKQDTGQSITQQETQQNQNSNIKDAVMTSVEPS